MIGRRNSVPAILFGCAIFAVMTDVAAADPVREVSVTYPSGEIRLAAALLLPDAAGPLPAAVIVQGSGSSDRGNGWARSIAEVMVDAGVAVLLTDKRGSGASGGDWRSSGFDDLADDALAGVDFLRTRPEIDRGRIGLVGLSQGGRVVPIAAARSAAVAFVVNMVGDAVSFGEQSAHEMANVARQAGLDEAQRREVIALNSAAGRAVLTDDWSEYRRLREAGLRSPWAGIAAGFPEVGAPVWSFYAKVGTFDPMSYWILVRQPTLIVYGEDDESDNVAVDESFRRLRFGFSQAGKENAQIVVLPGVGHALGWRPEAGLGAAAAEELAEWLKATAAAL